MNVGDRVKIPLVQTIGCCNVSRCNAVITAKMYYQDYLTVTGSREDERGTIITVAGRDGDSYGESDFRLADLEVY